MFTFIFCCIHNSKFLTNYSISDLEKLSGIKAHTLRIWESRYGIITPSRTKTNIRYYTDQDLKKILNIALLNKKGHKISKIVQLTDEQINEEVVGVKDISDDFELQMQSLHTAMVELDEDRFNHIITYYYEAFGMKKTIIEVIYPFLEKMSLMWLADGINQVQENFITVLIRQKLIVAIDAMKYSPTKQSKTFFLYLPEGETQELSMLLLQFLIKSCQHKVYYLGTNVNINDLKETYDLIKPDYIYTMISETFVKQPIQRYIDLIGAVFRDCTILLSGYLLVHQDISLKENMKVLDSLSSAVEYLNDL